jgi:hypothetical protein
LGEISSNRGSVPSRDCEGHLSRVCWRCSNDEA